MSVHGDGGLLGGEEHDNICCFRSYTLKLHECFSCFFKRQRQNRLQCSMIFFKNCACGLFYCFGFALVEPSRFDGFFNLGEF